MVVAVRKEEVYARIVTSLMIWALNPLKSPFIESPLLILPISSMPWALFLHLENDSDLVHANSFTSLLLLMQVSRFIQSLCFLWTYLLVIPFMVLVVAGLWDGEQNLKETLGWIVLFMLIPPQIGYFLLILIPLFLVKPTNPNLIGVEVLKFVGCIVATSCLNLFSRGN